MTDTADKKAADEKATAKKAAYISYQTQYRLTHKEKGNATSKAYYAANKERLRIYYAKYRRDHNPRIINDKEFAVKITEINEETTREDRLEDAMIDVLGFLNAQKAGYRHAMTLDAAIERVKGAIDNG